jgi:hypothetical protein
MLVVERDGATVVMDAEWIFREGDRVAIAMHVPERDDTIRALVSRGWKSAVERDRHEQAASPPLQAAGFPVESSHD